MNWSLIVNRCGYSSKGWLSECAYGRRHVYRHWLKACLTHGLTYLLSSGYCACCSMKMSVDQCSELERDLSVLESWMPTAFDRLTSAADISSNKSAEQLAAQMQLLLVSCFLCFLCISLVNQHRARLVLRWTTLSGFSSRCWTFISVCNQPATQGQLSLPSLRGW